MITGNEATQRARGMRTVHALPEVLYSSDRLPPVVEFIATPPPPPHLLSIFSIA
jgi:hypothetical protein